MQLISEMNATFPFAGMKDVSVVKRGYDVMGGYMSPVNDAHKKKDLANASHRVEMCKLASDTSDIIMIDEWEARQSTYQRSLVVLNRITKQVNCAVGEGVEVPRVKVCVPACANSFIFVGNTSYAPLQS